MLISIVTPIYNRAHLLTNLYHSLLDQHQYNFEWIIIDDGSTDNIFETVCSFQKESPFTIRYSKKENGGKHTAINESMKLTSADWIFIVDSDDTITPTATEIIQKNIFEINDEKCCGLICLKKNKESGELCGVPFINKKINNIELANSVGDKVIILNKKYFLENSFPIFEDEKFITEAYVWNKVLDSKYLLALNEIIYICEYLPDGLTENYYNLLKRNTKGTIAFVISNLNLKNESLGLYKQSIYHFYPTANISSIREVFKNTTKKKSFTFIILLILFIIKKLIKR